LQTLRGIEERMIGLADRLDAMEGAGQHAGGRAPAALAAIADEITALGHRLDRLPDAGGGAEALAGVAWLLFALRSGFARF
ncbi:hypothetical protein J8J40_33055, partial [Mycobacterium tuberculosis]|nr:hypothetical protein [Mycobacterium tuberculosis]